MKNNPLPLVIFAGILVIGGLYVQYAVIRDCGWAAFLDGAEWWWLFGYCH